MTENELTQLHAFLLQHYQHLTNQDMAEELNLLDSTIIYHCKKLGIKAISQKEKVHAFILEYYQRKPKKWIAARLNICAHHIDNCYVALNIQEPEWPAKIETISPRTIFSRASVGNYKQLLGKL